MLNIVEYSHQPDVLVTFIVFGNVHTDEIKAHAGRDAAKMFLKKYPQDEVVEVDQLPFE